MSAYRLAVWKRVLSDDETLEESQRTLEEPDPSCCSIENPHRNEPILRDGVNHWYCVVTTEDTK